MKKNRCNLILITGLLVAIISSCQPPTGSELQNIQVRAVSPEKLAGNTEEFPLTNCGGNGRLIQTLGMQGSVTKSIEMGATVSVSGSGQVGIPAVQQLELEAAVEAAYKQEYETANSRLDTVIMEAAPKSHVIYTIEWEKQEFSSVVIFEYDEEMLQTPYTFTLNVPKIAGSREIGCPETPRATQGLTMTPGPSAETFRLAGVWEGTDSRGVLFRFTFGSECSVNDICGKVELPTVGCTAFPVLISSSSDTFIFEQTNRQNCFSPTGNDTIKLLEDGTLLYGSDGQPPTIILYKK